MYSQEVSYVKKKMKCKFLNQNSLLYLNLNDTMYLQEMSYVKKKMKYDYKNFQSVCILEFCPHCCQNLYRGFLHQQDAFQYLVRLISKLLAFCTSNQDRELEQELGFPLVVVIEFIKSYNLGPSQRSHKKQETGRQRRENKQKKIGVLNMGIGNIMSSYNCLKFCFLFVYSWLTST